MNYREEYKSWCTDAYFDEDTKAELKALEGMRQRLRIVSIRN